MPVSWRGRRAGQCLKNWKKMEMKTWQKAVKAKMASQMVNRIRKNGVGAEKNENGGNSSAGQNTDEEAAENDSSTGESENDSQESKTESEAEPTDQLVNLVFSGDILLSDHVMNAYEKRRHPQRTGQPVSVCDR